MLAWCLVSTALLAATTFAQAGARSDGRRHGSGLVAAPRDPSETAHRSRLDDRYQIGGFTLQEWTSPDGRVWTVKHPDETTLPLLQTPPDGTSPRDPDIFWVPGKVGRFTTRMPPLPVNDTLKRVFDATPMLSHPDKSVLAEDRDIRQWTVDSRNWTVSNRPYITISEAYPEGFSVQVPSNLAPAKGYTIRIANVSDPSITYFISSTFEIRQHGPSSSSSACTFNGASVEGIIIATTIVVLLHLSF